MVSYILLLRAINVGGRNLLPMKELSLMLGSLSCQNVKTYLQTGNVIFNLPELDKDAEDKFLLALSEKIELDLAFKPELLLFAKERWQQALKANPYVDYKGNTVHFYFCQENPRLEQELIKKYQNESESYVLSDKVFYLHAPNGIGRSKLVSNVEKCLGVAATGRNMNTVNKLTVLLNDKP